MQPFKGHKKYRCRERSFNQHHTTASAATTTVEAKQWYHFEPEQQ